MYDTYHDYLLLVTSGNVSDLVTDIVYYGASEKTVLLRSSFVTMN